MKWIFLIIVCVHALIHSLGFVKSFGLAEIKELKLPISHVWGMFWLVSAVCWLGWGALRFGDYRWSWILGLLASLLSFCLLIWFWSDAKFGLILTIPLAFLVSIDSMSFQFANQIEDEKCEVLSRTGDGLNALSETELPVPVQKWLDQSLKESTNLAPQVHLKQQFQLKLKPEQNDWYLGHATQQFNLNVPGFIWEIDLAMNPFLQIKGRDKLDQGKGAMTIRLFSAFPLVNQSDTEMLNEGTLQRFLGEIVWFPYFAKSSLISWEEIDPYCAKATLTQFGTGVTGTFTFSKDYRFEKFETMRYFGGDTNAKRYPWVIEANEWQTFHGIEIPSKCRATWILDSGPWTWAEIEILEIMYKNE